MKKILLSIMKFFGAILPQTVPEFIYTTLLKPRFLKQPINALLSSFIPEYIKVEAVEIAMNKNDPVLCGALTLGVYEKCELKLLYEKLKPGMTFIDIGANVGLYTALGAIRVGNQGEVFAFEPDRNNFSFLRKTVAKNNFKNVECYQTAISYTTGVGRLYLSEENLADHRIYDSNDKRESISIDIMSLDHFVAQRNIAGVDFIKMDIQGAEGMAIKGMKKVLTDNPHVQIFSEFWPLGIVRTGESPIAFLATLKKYGFKLFSINRTHCTLRLVSDIDSFSNNLRGREFANLYCKK